MPERVLYICHNHPAVRPGGAEGYALSLHRTMRSTPGWESIFLAHSGPPLTTVRRYHDGALFALDEKYPDEYFCHNEFSSFDTFNGWNTDKSLWTYLRDFLLAYRPDVVHFQHTLFFGYDMIREVRNTLPNSAIVYTLHDFIPICNQHGQMLRTINDDELCTHASSRRCHECFPNHTPQAFFMRKRYVQAMFELVDRFIAPSEFLRQRYVEWGIPANRIVFEENGCGQATPTGDVEDLQDNARIRVGYFGQLNRFKGINVLLDAMRLLQEAEAAAHLWIHGANLDLQSTEFQSEFNTKLAKCDGNVTVVGKYQPESLGRHMSGVDWVVVPSIWWENSPLVIQEAFLFGRPVICSDIGGMAEKVTHGVNGLHFYARDPVSLARTIRRATETPGLWQSLRQGIPKVHTMGEHVANLSSLYRDLLTEKRGSRVLRAVRS